MARSGRVSPAYFPCPLIIADRLRPIAKNRQIALKTRSLQRHTKQLHVSRIIFHQKNPRLPPSQ